MTTITVNHNLPTELLFDLEIDGLSTLLTVESRFCIYYSSDHIMSFICSKIGDKQFKVAVPALSMLEKNQTYRFTIEVITDGYYFKALDNSLTIKEQVKQVVATIAKPTTSDPVVPSTVPKRSEPVVTAPPKEEKKLVPTAEPSNTPLQAAAPEAAPEEVTSTQKIDVAWVFDKKKPTSEEFTQDFVDKNQKVLNILQDHQKESLQKKGELISKGVVEALEIREKNRRAQQILKQHQESKK